MANIIAIYNSVFARRGKIILVALACFTIFLLANWRLIWGWFYYYTEYYNASSDERDISGKCVFVLKERNFWNRVQNSKDWWWRMRCEGNAARSLNQRRLPSFEINPMVSQIIHGFSHIKAKDVEVMLIRSRSGIGSRLPLEYSGWSFPTCPFRRRMGLPCS
jgi:hypothetical protein